MPMKIVDAYDEDGQVFASYPVILDDLSTPLNDEHYVQEAKECHEQDGLTPSFVKKWVVRDPRSDEA